MNTIETKNLTKKFGTFTAVDGINLTVSDGEVLALLGPNGAGKTTTVRMLAAILRPTRGAATVAGYDTVKDAVKVRHIVGLLTEFPGLYGRMKSEEYLHFFGELQGMSKEWRVDRIFDLLTLFELWNARHLRLGSYSKGMKQKLALIRAVLHEPQIVFLDEPTSAMDPHSAKLVRDYIKELRDADNTLIVCTHNLAEAEMLADRIAIISKGQIIALGTFAELQQQLLGDPLMELRLAYPIDGAVSLLSDIIRIEERGENWLRYRTARPEQINPLILDRLAVKKYPVVTLSALPRRLEEVYLRIVER